MAGLRRERGSGPALNDCLGSHRVSLCFRTKRTRVRLCQVELARIESLGNHSPREEGKGWEPELHKQLRQRLELYDGSHLSLKE